MSIYYIFFLFQLMDMSTTTKPVFRHRELPSLLPLVLWDIPLVLGMPLVIKDRYATTVYL